MSQQPQRSSRPQFAGAYVRLERARQHIELLRHPKRFLGDEKLEMRLETRRSTRTGQEVLGFRPRDHRALLRMGAAVGDAIHNLRATLDKCNLVAVVAQSGQARFGIRALRPLAEYRLPYLQDEPKVGIVVSGCTRPSLGCPSPCRCCGRGAAAFPDRARTACVVDSTIECGQASHHPGSRNGD
jgi:hypothetical protein